MPGRTLVAISAVNGDIRQLNHHCELTTGPVQKDVLGRPIWLRLAAPESAESMRDGFLRTAAGEDAEDQRGTWRTKDGLRFAVHWGYSGLHDASGTTQSVVVTGADMRISGRMSDELIEALDSRQAILDTAVDGIITIADNGSIRSFNLAAERIFGYRAGEVLGLNVAMLMPMPYRNEHDSYLRNYLTTRHRTIIGFGREVEGLRKDGTIFPLDLSVGEMTVSGQRAFTGIIRDITDRKQLELESRRRQDELAHLARVHSMGDLAAGLAHEINQPLTAIIGYSNAWLRLIDAGNPDIALLRDSMDKIVRQAERAAEVIRRLRKYVERGEIEMQRSNPGVSGDSTRFRVAERLPEQARTCSSGPAYWMMQELGSRAFGLNHGGPALRPPLG